MRNLQNAILSACALILTGLICWVVITKPDLPGIQKQQQEIPTARLLPEYPINMQVTSYIGNPTLDESLVAPNMGDKLISVLTKVTYDEEHQQYVYEYKIGYLGKKPAFLSWTVLDQVVNDTVNGTLFPLEPEQVKEFTFISKAPPTLSKGTAWLYRPRNLNEKTVVWDCVPLESQPGPLPKK